MSKKYENTTKRCHVEMLKGSDYSTADAFCNMLNDYHHRRCVWREVTASTAKYMQEAGEIITGPSGSFAMGEVIDIDRYHGGGAIHYVAVPIGGVWMAKCVALMRWADELLTLREAIKEEI